MCRGNCRGDYRGHYRLLEEPFLCVRVWGGYNVMVVPVGSTRGGTTASVPHDQQPLLGRFHRSNILVVNPKRSDDL
jgi:hypothetical protein